MLVKHIVGLTLVILSCLLPMGTSVTAQLGSLEQLGKLPKMPSLHSGILSPTGLTPVGAAVEFGFNPLYSLVHEIYMLDASGERVKEILQYGAGISVKSEGFCYRFLRSGLIRLETVVSDLFGRKTTSQSEFTISDHGLDSSFCKPISGGRVFPLANPDFSPEYEQEGLDRLDGSYAGGDGFKLSWKGRVWKKSWSNMMETAVERHGRRLLEDSFVRNSGVKRICPGYFTATYDQKKKFWVTWMASISFPESGYDTETVFMEPAPLNKNSVGLFQLSYDDKRHGGGCDFSGFLRDEYLLKDPSRNIRCAATIMQNQIEQRGTLWPRKAYYWSVLSSSKKIEVRAIFNAYKSKFLRFCDA